LYACHATFQAPRILLDLIHELLMAVAGIVIALSSIKMDAPASKEGT
jgi:hypothetical protein